jgi:uncharacterized protein involved in type VI secretion and phage assembly
VNAHLLELLADSARHGDGRINGAVIGVVTNNKDTEGFNRVRVKFPWLSDNNESWARMAAPMAGNDRGLYFLPEVDDEVLVLFDRGDPRFPFIVGALWNGKDKAPADNADGKNAVRVIKSRSGHVIRFNDTAGGETLEIVDAKGKNSIVIDTAKNSITITAESNLVLQAPKGKLELNAKEVLVQSSAAMTIKAGGPMNVGSDGKLALTGKVIDLN